MGAIIQAQHNFDTVDNQMNEAVRFDEAWFSCDSELKRISDDLEEFVKQYPPCSFLDKFKGPFFIYPWQDPVIWNILQTSRTRETELAVILGEIPYQSSLHQLRADKLRGLTKLRIEIEGILEKLAKEYQKPCYTTLIVDRPRTPIKIEKPRRLVSFHLYWDFLLRFFRNCAYLKVVYGIYKKGEPLIAPRFAAAKTITEYGAEEGVAIYNEYTNILNTEHFVKELLVDPDNILVFEVQGRPQSKRIHFRPEDFDVYSNSGTGYPLWRYKEDDDALKLDLNVKIGDEETLAWSVLDLFNQQGDLNCGSFKVPLYLPPSSTDIEMSRLHESVTKAPYSSLYMRVEAYSKADTRKLRTREAPQPSVQSFPSSRGIDVLPSNESSYIDPAAHMIDCELSEELRVRREADKNYVCKGIHLYVHHVEGITPERHVRVGYLLQFGKYVVKSKGGMFCFFLTKGVNPFNIAGLKTIRKSDKQKEVASDTIPFDDGIRWEKNFYEMISHYWSIGLMKDLNVVLVYLQLKKGIKPTVQSVINKAMLYDEYDILGYGVLKLHDHLAKIRYGTAKLPLYDTPIFVEDLREQDKNGGYITVSVEEVDREVAEINLDVKERIIEKIEEAVKRANTPFGTPNNKKGTPGYKQASPSQGQAVPATPEDLFLRSHTPQRNITPQQQYNEEQKQSRSTPQIRVQQLNNEAAKTQATPNIPASMQATMPSSSGRPKKAPVKTVQPKSREGGSLFTPFQKPRQASRSKSTSKKEKSTTANIELNNTSNRIRLGKKGNQRDLSASPSSKQAKGKKRK